MKDLDSMKQTSLKHRLAMARNYDKPEKYLSPEEMELYKQELEEYQARFDHLDKSGPYRPEQIDGRWYVVGHGKVSHPVYNFEAYMALFW